MTSSLIGANRVTGKQTIAESFDEVVPAGESVTVEISPPEGKMWILESFREYNVEKPSEDGATSGEHRIIFGTESSFISPNLLVVQSNYQSRARILRGDIVNGSLELPSTESIADFYQNYKPMIATPSSAFQFEWENSTDAEIDTSAISTDRIRFTVIELDL